MDKEISKLNNNAKDQFSTAIPSAKDKSITDNKSQQDKSMEKLYVY